MSSLLKSSPKIAVDTSALISLAHGDFIDLMFNEFDVIISDKVLEELEQTAQFDDVDGLVAKQVLKLTNKIEVRSVDSQAVESLLTSRIDLGEASCIVLAEQEDVQTLISDDFRAMHQLQVHSQTKGFDLGFGAVLIQALVLRGKLSREEALDKLEYIASKRNWMGRPIYRAYRQLIDSADS